MTKPTENIEQSFLPRYQTKGFVGEGAAARIFRVVDKRNGAVRAIKALKPETNAEASVVKRFEDEYRILRGLHHPSLPEVYDYGFTRERNRYMVMELVEGERLDDYFGAHPGDLWLLLYQLCEALSFIHSQNLLHLDLKPANILVKRTSAYGDEKPVVMLMDFGLSYRRDEGGDVSLVGTPEYMAPEIIRGEEQLTRAADYYSLGITLYELLVGETPYRGEVRDVFAGHLTKDLRFREEKTEYAELYPHVLGLATKDARVRLEAFEDFKRAVVGRLAGGIDELERAYALSFLSSIGTIGKKEAWEDIKTWLDEIDGYVESNARETNIHDEASTPQTTDAAQERASDESDIYFKSLEAELLANVKDQDIPETRPKTEPPCHVMTVSGPAGSGKTYLLGELVEFCRIQGRNVWALGEAAGGVAGHAPHLFDVEVGQDKPSSRSKNVDPRSVVLDRYMNGWDRLAGEGAGAVLVVDGLENLDEETKGFIEYASRRLGIAQGDDRDPGVYIVVSGNHPQHARHVTTLLEGQIKPKSVVLPPLQKDDIAGLVSRFAGKTVSVDDRKRLQEFVTRFDEGAGAIATALNDALLKGALLYREGMWQFRPTAELSQKNRADLQSSYYKGLLSELPAPARETLEWICCHEGPITFERLSSISTITTGAIEEAIDSAAPFQILDASITDADRKIGFVSQTARRALYRNIDTDRRRTIHEAYAQEYAAIFDSLPRKNVDRNLQVGSQLAHHYQQLGEYRDMLLTQLRVMRLLRKKRRFYELRQVAESGLNSLVVLKGRKWSRRRWHIRRYYLKQLLEAHWALSDYRSLRKLIGPYFSKRRKQIPLSLMFKYCMALSFAGEHDAVMAIVNRAKRQARNKNSQPYVVARLLEAIVLNNKAKYGISLGILSSINTKSILFNEYEICRMYMLFVVVYDKIGDTCRVVRYNRALEVTALRNGFVHEYLMSISARFLKMFNKSNLADCQSLARSAIAVASRNKSYYRLSEWFYRAGGIYFEKGQYKNSIRYIDKARQFAVSLGLLAGVTELLTRLAMNYQNMGFYGNSIIHMEKARETMSSDIDPTVGAEVVLFSLDIFLVMNSRKAKRSLNQADRYMAKTGEKRRVGYYWYLTGLYHHKKLELRDALNCLKRARRFYEKTGIVDDAVRAGVKEAFVLVELGRFKEAKRLIECVTVLRRGFESKNIEAEYRVLQLAYDYYIRSSPMVIKSRLAKCEEAAKAAREMPVLLAAERMVFRAKARIGDVRGAKRIFRAHYKKIKNILSNMPDKNYALDFLNERDEKLLMREYKIIDDREKGARRCRTPF